MTLLLPLIFLLLGVGLRYFSLLPDRTPRLLNAFVINVSLPAITLLYIHQLQLTADIIIPAAVAWAIFIISIPLCLVAGKLLSWDKKTIGAVILCCGLGNTSFVGFPVIASLYGQEALKIAVLVDQPGGFLILSTLGLATAAYFAGQKVRPSVVLKKMLLFPAFPIFIISIALAFLQISLPGEINWFLGILGKTITPFALTSIGMQLSVSRKDLKPGIIAAGLSYKLLVAPALIFLAFMLYGNPETLTAKVCIMESAMGPMVSAAIVAIQYNLRPKLVSQLAGIGIPLSFLTLAVWYFVIG
ncbi:MAG: AEC family transporter [Cyclobacteriaceae bacterium]